MDKLQKQSPLLDIVNKINELVDVVVSDSKIVKSMQTNTGFSDSVKMEKLNRNVYEISITGSYKISTNSKGNIYIRVNDNKVNDRVYELNRDHLEVNNLVLCSGDKLFFVSENAEAYDDVFIELQDNIIKYIYDTKRELERAINLYKPMHYDNFTKEQIEALKGEPFRYGDFTASQLKDLEGKSAYEVWLDEGNIGTKKDFLRSLKGKDGVINFSELTEEEKNEIKPDLSPYVTKSSLPNFDDFARNVDVDFSVGNGLVLNEKVFDLNFNVIKKTITDNISSWWKNDILDKNLKIKGELLNSVSKADINLGNVSNYKMATEVEAIKGESNERYMSPWRTRQFVEDYTYRMKMLDSEYEYETLKNQGKLDKRTVYFIKESN